MKVGDLVRCKQESQLFDSGPDSGIGIVIQIEEWDRDGLSICVQWPDEYLWYQEKELELISESR